MHSGCVKEPLFEESPPKYLRNRNCASECIIVDKVGKNLTSRIENDGFRRRTSNATIKHIINQDVSHLENWSLTNFIIPFSETCRGNVMGAYTKPQQRKKEENERLSGERYQIKFIDLR